ncbi:MAG: reverse transcriptase family protein [Gemmataceae bacterium]|nr:reverse transcriptase family protein [Gemmataceae bacterium]
MNWLRRLWQSLFGSSTPRGESSSIATPRGESSSPAGPDTSIQARASTAPPAAATSVTATPPKQKPRYQASFDLSAADFLPIPREDMVDEAKARGRPLWSNPWFGRRDLIPPADDPRTKLIDRGMVGEGIVTPEELVAIHEVGVEMENRRATLEFIQHEAARAGESAVEADRARRAALKAQKKQEVAERKRQRAEAVARRRATDIVFLGRGVSSRLDKRASDAAKLAAQSLPVLNTPADVARALGLSIPRLRWLAFHNETATRTHYVHFSVPKKSGGTRVLSAPHRTLAKAQRWIFQNILQTLPAHAAAHGFVRGRNILSNAQPHAGHAVLVNLDVRDFFPSITFPRVRSVFQRLGYSPAVATVFALLCTECPRRQVLFQGKKYFVATGQRGLPQGACTSPALANQVARRLDHRLIGLARALSLNYTRYADDLTFSGDDNLKGRVGYLMAKVRHIAQDEGFTINEDKSRVLRRNAAQLVTGLVVNQKPTIRRQEIRRLRAILHRARHEGLEKQNRTGDPRFLARLRGKIALVHMIRPDLGLQFSQTLKALTGTRE